MSRVAPIHRLRIRRHLDALTASLPALRARPWLLLVCFLWPLLSAESGGALYPGRAFSSLSFPLSAQEPEATSWSLRSGVDLSNGDVGLAAVHRPRVDESSEPSLVVNCSQGKLKTMLVWKQSGDAGSSADLQFDGGAWVSPEWSPSTLGKALVLDHEETVSLMLRLESSSELRIRYDRDRSATFDLVGTHIAFAKLRAPCGTTAPRQ